MLCAALIAGAIWLTLRVISAPPPAALVAVPDLSGMSLEEATAKLRDSRLTLGTVTPTESSDADKDKARENIGRNMDWLEGLLADGRPFLTGKDFTVADAYAFVVAGWSPRVSVDLSRWPNVAAFVARVAERPAVVAAMKSEGLI